MELKRVLRGIFVLFERSILNGTGLGGSKRWIIYLACISAGLGTIWLPLITFLKTSPMTYTTKWILILPGAGTGSSINLESIGQAATAVNSPYTSASLDPKVSYKQIVKSDAVLGAASASLGMTVEEFGEPRIKLVAQTTLMYFSMTGLDPEKTHARAVVLIKALKDQLAKLRQDESERRVETAQLYIRGFQDKLHRIKEKLLAYQKESSLISEGQLQDLAAAVAAMRQEKAMSLAQYKKAEGQAAQLAGMLSTPPPPPPRNGGRFVNPAVEPGVWGIHASLYRDPKQADRIPRQMGSQPSGSDQSETKRYAIPSGYAGPWQGAYRLPPAP